MFSLIFIAAWIIYSLWFGGFPYTTLICGVAALWVILPLILKIDIVDVVKKLKSYQKDIWLSLAINFVLWPLAAFFVGKLLFDLNDTLFRWLLLLSILPWWGLLLYRVKKTWGDIQKAFVLFFVNLLAFSAIYFLTSYFWPDFWNFSSWPGAYVCTFEQLGMDYISCYGGDGAINPLTPLLVLIVFPLILALIFQQLAKKVKVLQAVLTNQKLLTNISKFFTGVVLFYIFWLSDVGKFLKNNLTQSLEQFWPVMVLYALMAILLLALVRSVKSELFWIWFSRFLMLGVFFVLPRVGSGWETVLILFLWAFLVQIGLNVLISTFLQWKFG